MTKTEFDNIINQNPSLTSHGRATRFHATDPDYRAFRQELLMQYDESCACVDFLKLCYGFKSTLKIGHSAVNLTNYIQEWYSYHFASKYAISEGALLVAAIYLDLELDVNGEPRVAIGELPDILDDYWDTGQMKRMGVFVID
jgi:hypothetical protein